jgi:P27 family predicted phage terminase small subunit
MRTLPRRLPVNRDRPVYDGVESCVVVKLLPPHLRLLRGDARHQRRDRGGSQLPLPPEPLPPPGFLSDRAKRVWTELAAELHRVGWLTSVDAPCFCVFCTTAARWLEVEEALAEAEGEGNPQLRRIARDLARDVLKFGAEFGLTPVSRLRLDVVRPEPQSKFRGLLAYDDLEPDTVAVWSTLTRRFGRFAPERGERKRTEGNRFWVLSSMRARFSARRTFNQSPPSRPTTS